MLLVVVFSLLSAAEAGERSKSFQVTATEEKIIVGLGEPPLRNHWLQFSTQLSELVVIDVDCGEPETGHQYSRYNSTRSNMSVLADSRDWTKKLYNVRPLQGRIYSDRMRLNQYWRWVRPRMDRIRIFEAQFVSAMLYDARLSSAGSAVFGLRPGPNSAALGFLNGLGAQRSLISLAYTREWDVTKTFINIEDLHVTFGALDNFRCVDWRWSYAPEFAVTASRVDFMGVEFRNVLLIFDLNSYVYSVPPKVAEILVDARVLKFRRKDGSVVHYSYIAGRDKFIRFRGTSGVTFLQIGHQANDFDESPIAVDPADISSDPRAEQLIFNMGATLLEQSCLAYDYANSRVGFAQRRPWPHPLYQSGGVGFDPGRPPWEYPLQVDGGDDGLEIWKDL